MEAKHGPELSSQPPIDVELWCEATQGPSKGGRLYGLGTTLSTSCASFSSKPAQSMTQDNEDNPLKEQLQ